MRILVIGSGGREHALVWKLRQSAEAEAVLVAPGNGGTRSEDAANIAVQASDLDGLVSLAKKERIDLVVPGPELPLTLGIADRLREAGIACFGPDAWCARLEGSKAFAKEMMARAGVPTASHAVFADADEARDYLRRHGAPIVVKADGLAAGKGVVVAMTEKQALAAINEILEQQCFGEAGARIVLEEYLAGEEVSLLCFCDGDRAVPMPSAQDHKAAWDDDQGPNTGGMGAYSPAPVLPDKDLEQMADLTVRPVLRELARDGHPYKGVIYAGLMMTASGPRVLEYNVRFGDPECQPLLCRFNGDLATVMQQCASGRLDPATVSFASQSALGIVLAARGYPGKYPKGMVISGLEEAEAMPGVKVFHAGTKVENMRWVSDGGRVLCVTAIGRDLADARKKAYEGIEQIRMRDSFYRKDIGDKGLRHKG